MVFHSSFPFKMNFVTNNVVEGILNYVVAML